MSSRAYFNISGGRGLIVYIPTSLASERAQSCSCSIEISDTYVYIYIYVYIYVAVRQVICACSVVRNVGGVKFNHFHRHSNHFK